MEAISSKQATTVLMGIKSTLVNPLKIKINLMETFVSYVTDSVAYLPGRVKSLLNSLINLGKIKKTEEAAKPVFMPAYSEAYKLTMEKAARVAASLPADYQTNPAHFVPKKTIEGSDEGFLIKKGNKVFFIDPEHILGSGSFKVVYLACEVFEQKAYAYAAINTAAITEEDKDTLEKEIQIQKQFRGSAGEGVVAGVQHVVREKGTVQGFLLDYFNAGNLGDYLNNSEDKPEEELWTISDDMAHALEVLKNQKDQVLHRDFKPENVMLHRDETGKLHAKLVDFGLSTMLSREILRSQANLKPELCGTSGFMAPEFVKGHMGLIREKITKEQCYKKVTDSKIDMWALGVTLYKMLNQKYPTIVDKYSRMQTFVTYETLNENKLDTYAFSEKAAIRHYMGKDPKTIEDVVRRAMSVVPSHRYSPKELRSALNKLKAREVRWRPVEEKPVEIVTAA